MTEHFKDDPDLRKVAELYALDAIDFARSRFKLELDWTDESVAHVESMLTVFHKQMPDANPNEEQVRLFAKMFGSYVGEVFRRNHGATWGMVNLQGNELPGLKSDGSAGLFWPWSRVKKRLTDGPEDNVWHYYQVLLERNGNGDASNSIDVLSPKKSWWSRFRGA